MNDQDPIARARSYVGTTPGAGKRSPLPVNEAMIAHWRAAFGDESPAYRDGEVPPAMLQTWCMEGSDPDGPGVVRLVMDCFDAAGFPAVIATNYEQTYDRPLRIGDRLTEQATVEEITEPKATALGEGHFVTFLNTYRDEAGEVVGTARMRVLRYRPLERPAPEPAGVDVSQLPRPRPVIGRDNAFFWEGVAAGELRIQRCVDCGTLRHPPAPMCGECQALGWDYLVASGEGTVHSFVVHHHPPLPGFTLPIVVGLVELAEGVRMVATLDVVPDEAKVGMPVRVVFAEVEDGLVLPGFRAGTGR